MASEQFLTSAVRKASAKEKAMKRANLLVLLFAAGVTGILLLSGCRGMYTWRGFYNPAPQPVVYEPEPPPQPVYVQQPGPEFNQRPDAPRVCSRCNGRGVLACQGGYGSPCVNGWVNPCTQCYGSGQLTSKRSGEVNRNAPCLVCRGRGKVICSKCGGRGQYVCPDCNGMGNRRFP